MKSAAISRQALLLFLANFLYFGDCLSLARPSTRRGGPRVQSARFIPHSSSDVTTTCTASHAFNTLISTRRDSWHLFSTDSSRGSDAADESESISTSSNDETDTEPTTKLAKFKKSFSSYFKGSEKDDGLTFRQRLAKMGLATVLSYGWISNTNAMILVAAAWYVFSLKTKMSPLYPGQWKNFLGVYAGFYVISNFLRPLRVTLAIAVGPYFDRLVNWIQRKLNVPKAAAITATVLLVNLGGTILLMIGGLSLASLLSGVPIFPPNG